MKSPKTLDDPEFLRALLQREQDRADKLEAEVTRLNSIIQEKMIPALITSTSALQANQEYFRAIQYQRDLEIAAERRAREGREEGDDGLSGVREPRR